jgi:hypothetical protein
MCLVMCIQAWLKPVIEPEHPRSAVHNVRKGVVSEYVCDNAGCAKHVDIKITQIKCRHQEDKIDRLDPNFEFLFDPEVNCT